MEMTKIIDRKDRRRLNKKLQKVEQLAQPTAKLSNEALQQKTQEFKQRLANGETLDDLLPEAFAAIREAAKRILGMYPYAVQVLGVGSTCGRRRPAGSTA